MGVRSLFWALRRVWRGFVRDGLDDGFVLVGAVLIGVGVFRLWPAGIWFYIGAWCVLIGLMIPQVRHDGSEHERETTHDNFDDSGSRR